MDNSLNDFTDNAFDCDADTIRSMREALSMINKMNIPEFMESINDLQTIQSEIGPALQIELSKIIELQEQFQHAFSAYINDSVLQIMDFSTAITKTLSSIPTPEISSNLQKGLNRASFIGLLKKIKWPMFLHYNDDLRYSITEICEGYDGKNYPQVKTAELIFNYCNNKFCYDLLDYWKKVKSVNPQRIPILTEAVELHLAGKYYASTSICMCQIYGVASDIDTARDENGISLTEKNKLLVSKHYKIDPQHIDSEKGKILQILSCTNNGIILWEVIATYLKEEILCSSESKERWEKQPLRNKICHGDQLNFGTKEHSLKALLCIDILMHLANEMEYIASHLEANEE